MYKWSTTSLSPLKVWKKCCWVKLNSFGWLRRARLSCDLKSSSIKARHKNQIHFYVPGLIQHVLPLRIKRKPMRLGQLRSEHQCLFRKRLTWSLAGIFGEILSRTSTSRLGEQPVRLGAVLRGQDSALVLGQQPDGEEGGNDDGRVEDDPLLVGVQPVVKIIITLRAESPIISMKSNTPRLGSCTWGFQRWCKSPRYRMDVPSTLYWVSWAMRAK